jgi:hypothetical protein
MALIAMTSTDNDTEKNHIFLASSINFIGKVQRCIVNLKEGTFLLLHNDYSLACYHLYRSRHARTYKRRTLGKADIMHYE